MPEHYYRLASKGKTYIEELQDSAAKEAQAEWDTKYGYHAFRFFDQAEQILFNRDINVRRNTDLMNEIRNGKIDKEVLVLACQMKEALLNSTFYSSNLPEEPDSKKSKTSFIRMYQDLL